MKKNGYFASITLPFLICCLIFTGNPVYADDTCVFSVAGDGLPMAGLQQASVKCPESGIISKWGMFMAPVVPEARTFSGDKIYLALFKPVEDNFWQGNVAKYSISSNNRIVDVNGNPVMQPDGAVMKDAVPYWSTKDWADDTKSNYIHNASRHIYTYLTGMTAFSSNNTGLTAAILGNPVRSPADIINYVRGADVFDENGNGDVTENRAVITGDVLHSEPSIFQYRDANKSSKTIVYFGANDGMLHAVLDFTQSPETGQMNYGQEAWAFIPTDQLPRLKEMIENIGHQVYIDATPKIFFKDIDKDGVVDTMDGDKVILVCGERKGGFGYFALDVTDPFDPQYLWRINSYDDSEPGKAGPTTIIAELGQTWSEPRFGLVKTSDSDTVGTPVFFIGGKAVIAINVLTGTVVKKFTTGMNYSFASSVAVIDENDNGFVDKVYVGDLGGQMWRFSSFVDSSGKPLVFPNCNENINSWTGEIFFKTDDRHPRKFFYPPSVTLEKGYDMVFMGTGDRENACCNNGSFACTFTEPDIIAGVKDTHSSLPIIGERDVAGSLSAGDLVNVTHPMAVHPDLTVSQDADSNGIIDQGWYIRLEGKNGIAKGEKVLEEGTVFYKTFYITTFTPNDDPSTLGGHGKLYALDHLTGRAVLDFDHDSKKELRLTIGDGIPSKPVVLITETGTKLLVSAESTAPNATGQSLATGVINIDPFQPPVNFYLKSWRDIF